MLAADEMVRSLREQLAIAREGRDPEGVHQVRVLSRRLDVWLRLGGWRVLRDDLRWLRGVAGPARDLDALATMSLPSDVHAAVVAERARAQPALRDVLSSPRVGGLLDALAVLPPVAADDAARRTAALLRRAVKLGRRLHPDDPDPEALHRLRRAVRRARYAIELGGGKAKRFVGFQDAFGAVNDKVVLLRRLERHADPGTVSWRAELRAAIEAARLDAIAAWRAVEDDVAAMGETWTSS